MKILGIDVSTTGIAGDMFIAGLLNIVQNQNLILSDYLSHLNKVTHSSVMIDVQNTHYLGMEGYQLAITGNETRTSVEDLLANYDKLSESLQLEGVFKDFGKFVLDLLVQTEKRVHSQNDMKLHELGTLDTLIDASLAAFLLQELEIQYVQTSPVATGTGFVRTAHGSLPVPAPATQLIIEEFSIVTVNGSQGEMTTPTGMAIIAALTSMFLSPQTVIWEAHGLGFGTKTFTDRGNFLRVRLGKTTSQSSTISILETNLDDVSGELLGDAVEDLLSLGALDVNYYPIFMKKNRPGYCLRVLSPNDLEDKLVNAIMKYTGTLGVRIQHLHRHVGSREMSKSTWFVEEWDREVTVSVKKGIRQKIEFSDLKRLASEMDITPLQVEAVLYRYLRE